MFAALNLKTQDWKLFKPKLNPSLKMKSMSVRHSARVGSIAKWQKNGSQGVWLAMKSSEDFVWIAAFNAILKFDKKTKKWFYKSLSS